MRNLKTLIMTIFLASFFILSGCIEQEKDKPSENSSILYVKEGYFNSISNAINSSQEGNTIIVSNGTYYETIIIDKSIILKAEDPLMAVLTSKENELHENDYIIINSDNVTVEGFKIINNYKNEDIKGIKINSSNNIIRNNTFQNIRYGIYTESDTSNNKIHDNSLNTTFTGIYISFSNNNKIFNNRAMNSTYGIYFNHVYNSDIYSNNLSFNEYGLRLKGSTDNYVYKNNFSLNEEGAYTCCGARLNKIYKNNFWNNTINGDDVLENSWYYEESGNYWSDYTEKYPNANQTGIFWDEPYEIYGGRNFDVYPLINPIK